ncbi:chemotaxis protein CheW [Ruminococcus sp. OA3]|uniref:chemotaxis protein CheW n=1 Tax=Ruminococcus sp. OA3 TaxID=2914164 RepID=UPI001F06C61A|nr:chemotaxis protein CheW [Ruminococcus sp. OA3]MCH1983024.1 chemotaxis protein CheW [Ruminococcus sp. OA3]
MDVNKEILCIPGKAKNYAVEFTYIKEICSDVMVSRVPCLPEYFMGVFQHQGAIIPVIRLEEEPETSEEGGRSVILILEYQEYQLGILLSGEPRMVHADDMTWIDMPDRDEAGTDIWPGKAFYKYQNLLFFLGDIEQLMDHLIIYHNI